MHGGNGCHDIEHKTEKSIREQKAEHPVTWRDCCVSLMYIDHKYEDDESTDEFHSDILVQRHFLSMKVLDSLPCGKKKQEADNFIRHIVLIYCFLIYEEQVLLFVMFRCVARKSPVLPDKPAQ